MNHSSQGSQLTRLRTKLSVMLSLAVGGLLVLVLLIAWLAYSSTLRYHYHLQRIEAAHAVLEAYLVVSDRTFRKLNAMGEIVQRGRSSDANARSANEVSLRDAIATVRQGIAAEVAL